MAESTGGHQYSIPSWYTRLVTEYTGLTFHEVRALPYEQYLAWRRDAFIWWLSRSEKGEEYLNNAWRMEQTEPDRAALRKKLKKEEGTDGGQ